MWDVVKNILAKKACFHEWRLVKENQIDSIDFMCELADIKDVTE